MYIDVIPGNLVLQCREAPVKPLLYRRFHLTAPPQQSIAGTPYIY
jgi:hypothetical protein